MSSFVQSHVRTPPPPGFHIDDNSKSSYLHGSNRAGAGSAPPLSFTSFSSTLEDLVASSSSSAGHSENLRLMLRPSADGSNIVNANPGGTTSATTATAPATSTTTRSNSVKDASVNGRSSSYVNLAAALGEGLAESMGDSLGEIGGNVHK